MAKEINKENDSIARKEASIIMKEQKFAKKRQQFLAKAENKERLMDFIFGKTDENPMEEIKS